MDINVKTLREALQAVAPALGKGKNAPDVSKYVLVGEGAVRASNGSIHIAVGLPAAKDAPFLVPHREVLDMLGYVPGSHIATLRIRRKRLEIKVWSTQMTVTTPEVDNFPALPQIDGETASLDGDRFLAGFHQVAAYAAGDADRPVLAGIALRPEADGQNTLLIGADGFRMAFHRLPGVALEREVIVPKTTLAILDRLWKKADKTPDVQTPPPAGYLNGPSMEIARMVVARRSLPVTLSQAGRFIQFVAGNATLISEVITGTYPQVESLVPKDLDRQVVVDAEAMYRATQQLQTIAGGGSNIIRLAWDKDMLLSAADGSGQNATVTVPLDGSTKPGMIAFNFTYLVDFLKDKTGPVMMETNTEKDPGLFTYRGHSGVVIMPMFVDWEARGAKGRAASDQAPAEVAGESEESACPVCSAAPGHPCITKSGGSFKDPTRVHSGRAKPSGEGGEEGPDEVS